MDTEFRCTTLQNDQIRRVLYAEFPWLWAIHWDWNVHRNIRILRAYGWKFFTASVPESSEQKISPCHIHTANRQVIPVSVASAGRNHNIFANIFEALEESVYTVESVLHLAVDAGDAVWIYLPANGTTFAELWHYYKQVRRVSPSMKDHPSLRYGPMNITHGMPR